MTQKSRKGGDRKGGCCSFCGTPAESAQLMFNGADGTMICSACIEHGYNLLIEHGMVAGAAKGKTKAAKGGFKPLTREDLMTPQSIKLFLDDYVIG